MNLSKVELQEMLREMGLKFSHDTSYEELLRMFQSENHRRWLGEHRPDGPKRVIRRRRSIAPATAELPSAPGGGSTSSTKAPSPLHLPDKVARKTAFKPRKELPARRFKRDSDAPVVSDRHQNVFATVLKRARRRCELCEAVAPEVPAPGADVKQFLRPFYLIPPNEGGQEVIKNVVALCPDCCRKLTNQPKPADLKTLKRKARQKVIASVVVVRR
jgi:5-methylcytosine-specific restriction enzyme A